jgi:serine/threonine-protein kinase
VDLAEALEAAHAAGVVHGGVGLDGVMVSREGRAILADFAIAGLAGALANTHSQLLGSVAATLTPEHLNDLPTSAATDVFALGSLLYRLLAGAYPFDAPSPMGMTLKLSMGTFDRLESKAPATPSGLAALVHRMIAPSPSDRPSAREVVSGLLELGPREDARRQRIRSILPPAPERAAPSAPRSTPPPTESTQSVHVGSQAAIPPPTSAGSAPEWVDSMGFDESAATEYTPELARAIEADAGIASPLLGAPREPARRASAPPPRMSTPHSRAESPTPIALYAVIAFFAIVILAGTVVTVVALAG